MAICTICHIGIGFNTLIRHARGNHGIPYKEYKPSIDALLTKSTALLNTSADFPLPPNGTAMIVGLTVHDGFECIICHYLTTNEQLMRQHKSIHSDVVNYIRSVKLQV